eukprot:TRINITY_DN67615_c7_g2_i1.p1 TRINITY_DN67615_c7_g2~~TRINITY_DN67615_c7_g2_i1.p1  ORF type:complete len:140 (+),score=1.28 TRINITY_DN67615_c7_g2_i1:245-664(+)
MQSLHLNTLLHFIPFKRHVCCHHEMHNKVQQQVQHNAEGGKNCSISGPLHCVGPVLSSTCQNHWRKKKIDQSASFIFMHHLLLSPYHSPANCTGLQIPVVTTTFGALFTNFFEGEESPNVGEEQTIPNESINMFHNVVS